MEVKKNKVIYTHSDINPHLSFHHQKSYSVTNAYILSSYKINSRLCCDSSTFPSDLPSCLKHLITRLQLRVSERRKNVLSPLSSFTNSVTCLNNTWTKCFMFWLEVIHFNNWTSYRTSGFSLYSSVLINFCRKSFNLSEGPYPTSEIIPNTLFINTIVTCLRYEHKDGYSHIHNKRSVNVEKLFVENSRVGESFQGIYTHFIEEFQVSLYMKSFSLKIK